MSCPVFDDSYPSLCVVTHFVLCLVTFSPMPCDTRPHSLCLVTLILCPVFGDIQFPACGHIPLFVPVYTRADMLQISLCGQVISHTNAVNNRPHSWYSSQVINSNRMLHYPCQFFSDTVRFVHSGRYRQPIEILSSLTYSSDIMISTKFSWLIMHVAQLGVIRLIAYYFWHLIHSYGNSLSSNRNMKMMLI